MTTTITTIESIMASLIIIGGRALIHNDDGCEGRESRGEERERERAIAKRMEVLGTSDNLCSSDIDINTHDNPQICCCSYMRGR